MIETGSANNKDGWHKLENGVSLHHSGQGHVELRSAHAGLITESENNAELIAEPVSGTDEKTKLEFVEFKFRMLSAVYIPGYGLDFSEKGVLKKALGLFSTKLFRNHNTAIESSLGISHSPQYTSSMNVEGVDAVYRIYRKFGEDVIDRLNVGVLDSTSVGIHFLYRKSHPDMGSSAFYESLGKNVDGQIVRFIITKILRISEASIVYSGADKNAKRLSAVLNEPMQYSGDIMEEELKQAREKLTESEKKLSEARSEVETLKAENAELKAKAEIADSYEKKLREQAVKNYRLAAGEKAKDEMVKHLETASLPTIQLLSEEFAEKVEELHPLTCKKCGGAVTRASSKEAGAGDAGKNLNEPARAYRRASDYKMPATKE